MECNPPSRERQHFFGNTGLGRHRVYVHPPLRAHSPAARPTQHRWASSKIGAPPRRPMGHRPSAGMTGWSPIYPGARRQRPLSRARLHPPGGARTPARRLISWGPPAIRPTRAHPQAHCSTEAPANTARRLGRGSMTSPATPPVAVRPPHSRRLREGVEDVECRAL